MSEKEIEYDWYLKKDLPGCLMGTKGIIDGNYFTFGPTSFDEYEMENDYPDWFEKRPRLWIPKYGEKFYSLGLSIQDLTCVVELEFFEYYRPLTLIGLCFRTREQAERMIEEIKKTSCRVQNEI